MPDNIDELSINGLSKLNWKAFEDFTYDVFQKYFTKHKIKLLKTRYSKDDGRDAEAFFELEIHGYDLNVKTWVEAKQRKANVNLNDIGKTLVLVLVSSVHNVFIVTNKRFTPQVIRAATLFKLKTDKNVYLIGGVELIQMAEKVIHHLPKYKKLIQSEKNKSGNKSHYPKYNHEILSVMISKDLDYIMEREQIKVYNYDPVYLYVELRLAISDNQSNKYYLECLHDNSIAAVYPSKYEIPIDGIGTISRIFALIPQSSNLIDLSPSIQLQITDGKKATAVFPLTKQLIVVKTILPDVITPQRRNMLQRIESELKKWSEGLSEAKYYFIQSEAGSGKTYFINKIRNFAIINGIQEIVFDGEYHKSPKNIVDTILRIIFPIPPNSAPMRDAEELHNYLQMQIPRISTSVIDFLVNQICESTTNFEKQESNIERLAEVCAYILVLHNSDKKRLIIFEDLHKVGGSIILFLIELFKYIKKFDRSSSLTLFLTSRQTPSIEESGYMEWFRKLETLISLELLEKNDLFALDEKHAVSMMQQTVPNINIELCKRIIAQGGRTPFYIREYIGLMLEENIIDYSPSKDQYILIDPSKLKRYVDEKQFSNPTWIRIKALFIRYGPTLEKFMNMAACLGKAFPMSTVLDLIIDSSPDKLQNALTQCEHLEIFKRSSNNPAFFEFDHDLIRAELLKNMSDFHRTQISSELFDKLPELNRETQIKLLYQAGRSTDCFKLCVETANQYEQNSDFADALPLYQLAICLIDPGDFNEKLSEYKNLLLNEWDDAYLFAPLLIWKPYPPENRYNLLLNVFKSTLRVLILVSAGTDDLTERIISEGLMITKTYVHNFETESLFRYYYGYLLFERNKIVESISEHQRVEDLISISESRECAQLRADNLLRLAIGYRRIGKFTQSRIYLLRGLRVVPPNANREYYLRFRSNYAATFFYTDPLKHHKYYQRSLEIAKRFNVIHRVERIHLALGTNYFRFNQYEKARDEFGKAGMILNDLRLHNEEIRFLLNRACLIAADEKEFDLAVGLLMRAESYAIVQKNFRRLWRIYANLATLHELKKGGTSSIFEYDSRVLQKILPDEVIKEENPALGVYIYNRERCALLNILLRSKYLEAYQTLVNKIRYVFPESFFECLEEDVKTILSGSKEQLDLHLAGHCKNINQIERFLITE